MVCHPGTCMANLFQQNFASWIYPKTEATPTCSLNVQHFWVPSGQLQLQYPGCVYLTDPTLSQVLSLPPGPGLCSQFALSSPCQFCPTHLSVSCTGSFVEFSTCSAPQFQSDIVHHPCATSLFPDRLTSLFQTATHHIVLCCVPFSAVCIFIIQCTASGLVYYTSNPALNRESSASSYIYLLCLSPGEVSLTNIRELMNSHSVLYHEEMYVPSSTWLLGVPLSKAVLGHPAALNFVQHSHC